MGIRERGGRRPHLGRLPLPVLQPRWPGYGTQDRPARREDRAAADELALGADKQAREWNRSCGARLAVRSHQQVIFAEGSTLNAIATCLAVLLVVSRSTDVAGGTDRDPLIIIPALMDAESAANLDAAVALFADDAFIINATGWKTADKEQLKWFVNTEIWLRDQFQLDDLSVDSEKVTWQEAAAAPLYVAPVKFSFEAMAQNDKIKSIVAHLPTGEIARIREACKAQTKEPLIYDRPCSEFVQRAEAHTNSTR